MDEKTRANFEWIVKHAIVNDLISMSRGAELLGVSVEEMIGLIRAERPLEYLQYEFNFIDDDWAARAKLDDYIETHNLLTPLIKVRKLIYQICENRGIVNRAELGLDNFEKEKSIIIRLEFDPDCEPNYKLNRLIQLTYDLWRADPELMRILSDNNVLIVLKPTAEVK